MITNLAVWLCITIVVLPFGFIVAAFFQIPSKKISLTELTLLGLLPVILLAITAGFFVRINIEFFTFTLCLALAIAWINREILRVKVVELLKTWRGYSTLNKLILVLFLCITGLQSSMPTNIPDDGLYYLQTVKWANNFGVSQNVIKYGLQYGQFSSWHILQAVFNFGAFAGNRLNNINGWLLIVFVIFVLQKLKTNNSPALRLYCFISIVCVAVFQYFITAPSPDLPIILSTFLVFYYFLFEEKTSNNFKIVCLLSFTAIMVKITSFYLLFIPIFYGRNIILTNKRIISMALLVLLSLSIKNLTTSGTLLFPFNIPISNGSADREISKILEEGNHAIWDLSISKDNVRFTNLPFSQKPNVWFFELGYKSVLNFLWVIGIILAGVFSWITKGKTSLQVFIISMIDFVILWNISPNYRFAIPLIILTYAVVFIELARRMTLNPNIIFTALLLSGVWLTPLIDPILKLSSNAVVSTNYPVKFKYLLVRAEPFVFQKYERAIFNGKEVYIPPKYQYPWDGPLPCVMRHHYEKYSN